MVKSAEEVCGRVKSRECVRLNKWWNDDARRAVREKEEARLKFHSNQILVGEFKEVKKRVKKVVDKCKKEAIDREDERLNELCVGNQREFWREEVRRGTETERKKLEAELSELKVKLEVREATPSLRTESSEAERSVVSSIDSVRTIIHTLNTLVNHRGEVDITDLKEELTDPDQFDLSEDLQTAGGRPHTSSRRRV